MESVLPFLPIALLALACPLIMGGMGVGVWLWARAHGEKKKLSAGCMGGHGEHQPQPADAAKEARLKEEVARLEQKVEALRRS